MACAVELFIGAVTQRQVNADGVMEERGGIFFAAEVAVDGLHAAAVGSVADDADDRLAIVLSLRFSGCGDGDSATHRSAEEDDGVFRAVCGGEDRGELGEDVEQVVDFGGADIACAGGGIAVAARVVEQDERAEFGEQREVFRGAEPAVAPCVCDDEDRRGRAIGGGRGHALDEPRDSFVGLAVG